MHIQKLDLNLLLILDTIYREGNITRASQQLHLTQPAVSHALGRLRDHLGDPLFTRQGTQMVPTPYTRNLIGPVRQALQLLERTLADDSAFDPRATRRTFHLGLRDVFEATVLPPLIARLQEIAPEIDIASVRIDRRDVEAELSAGALDLVLDVPLAVSDRIRQTRISRDRLVVLARNDNTLPQDTLDLDTYLARGHVLVSSRRKGPGLEDLELGREGLRRRIALRCQHYFAACRVVSQTDLLLTMPEQYAQIANRQFANRIHPFPAPAQALDAHLYWHENAENDPANRWLRELLKALPVAGMTGGGAGAPPPG